MLENKIEFDISSFYDGCRSNFRVNEKKEQELFDEFVSQKNSQQSKRSKQTELKKHIQDIMSVNSLKIGAIGVKKSVTAKLSIKSGRDFDAYSKHSKQTKNSMQNSIFKNTLSKKKVSNDQIEKRK